MRFRGFDVPRPSFPFSCAVGTMAAWRFEAIALFITPMRADGTVIKPRSSCDRTRAADALPYDPGLLRANVDPSHVPGLSRKKALSSSTGLE
eukprot:5587119-Prymnesium_polylepis.1